MPRIKSQHDPKGNTNTAIKRLSRSNYILSAAVLVLAIALIFTVLAFGSSISSIRTEISNLHFSSSGNSSTVPSYNLTGTLLVPPTSIPSDPVIAKQMPFGSRLTNINQPLNATDLAVINDAPNSYFETAGEMLLNGSLVNYASGKGASAVPPFMVNGKPSMIYLGSITCVFCGENRWAMALALSRFGKFSRLYTGYSSFGDHNLPTLYWSPAHYNQSAEDLGAFYNSSYINFIAVEDTNPITGGFVLNPLSTMQSRINATNNTIYMDAMKFILQLNNFQGTPYTIWGKYNVAGADAVDFGNSTPTNNTLSMTNMTHASVFKQLTNPTDQFALTEYAGADIYAAMMCSTLNGTTTNMPSICSLPAIKGIESSEGI